MSKTKFNFDKELMRKWGISISVSWTTIGMVQVLFLSGNSVWGFGVFIVGIIFLLFSTFKGGDYDDD